MLRALVTSLILSVGKSCDHLSIELLSNFVLIEITLVVVYYLLFLVIVRLTFLTVQSRKMLLLIFEVLFKVFQFASYALAAFTFFKYYVLPTTRLVSSLTSSVFLTRHPEARWPGRTADNPRSSRLVTPVEGIGPFAPRYRNDHIV